MGLVKYLKLYGMSSDTAAAIVLARRAMRLSERIPLQVAYPIMTMGKHEGECMVCAQSKTE